jgi:hypothetical protein
MMRQPTAGMLAGTAFAWAGVLTGGFLRFHPEIGLSGHDRIADVANPKLERIGSTTLRAGA